MFSNSLEHVSSLDIRSLLPVSALLLNGCQQDADGDPFGRIADILQRWKCGGEAQGAVIRIAPIGPGSSCRGKRQTDVSSKLDDVSGCALHHIHADKVAAFRPRPLCDTG